MKLKHLFALLAAFAITVPAIAEDDTPLGKEMEKISKALKAVNRDLADPSKKADNLKKIADAKEACAAGAKMDPAKTKEVSAADKAKFLEGYGPIVRNRDRRERRLFVLFRDIHADFHAVFGHERIPGHHPLVTNQQHIEDE